MAKFRVRRGYTHGAFDQFKAGDVVELTEVEAQGFADKLEPISDSPEPGASPDSVLPEPNKQSGIEEDAEAKTVKVARR